MGDSPIWQQYSQKFLFDTWFKSNSEEKVRDKIWLQITILHSHWFLPNRNAHQIIDWYPHKLWKCFLALQVMARQVIVPQLMSRQAMAFQFMALKDKAKACIVLCFVVAVEPLLWMVCVFSLSRFKSIYIWFEQGFARMSCFLNLAKWGNVVVFPLFLTFLKFRYQLALVWWDRSTLS